jgi:DNA repair exonuclease SbcCD ATPase subunit
MFGKIGDFAKKTANQVHDLGEQGLDKVTGKKEKEEAKKREEEAKKREAEAVAQANKAAADKLAADAAAKQAAEEKAQAEAQAKQAAEEKEKALAEAEAHKAEVEALKAALAQKEAEEAKKKEEEAAKLEAEAAAAAKKAEDDKAAAEAHAKEVEEAAAKGAEEARKQEEARKLAEAEAAKKQAEEAEAKAAAEAAAKVKAAEEAAAAVREEEVAALREAMKGFGTDEKTLIDILSDKGNADMQALLTAYNTKLSRDLIKDVKKECSGDFEDVLVAMCTAADDYDAQLVRKAIKGLGTNEHLLTEVLTTRTPEELRATVVAYKRVFDRDMMADIEADVGGELQKLYINLLTQKREEGKEEDIDADVKALYDAGEGKIGTSKGVFVRLLGNHSRAYCEKLYEKYAQAHGKALDVVIKSEIGGSLSTALSALVTPLDIWYADMLLASMKGAGTRDHDLIRLIVSQRERNLPAASKRFLQENKKTVKVWVSSECSGNYKKALVAVCEKFC